MVGEDGFEANAYDAYLAGMRWAATQYAKAQKAAMETRQPNQAAQLHFQRKGRTFDGKRESALAMMDTLSKALGEDFWVFESYEKNGKRVYADETGAEHAAPNGFYDKNGVHIDLNAGNDGRGVMLYTLGHELTHYIRQNSPEKFKAFADLIVESFGNRGVSADALIQEQIAKAARNGRNISYETAYEEMIADSMETILADGKALERLGQIQQKEPSLGQTIRQWAKDTAEKIRAVVNAYKGEKADSLEGRITAQLEQVLPELEELYAEGLADASGTGRAETREGAKKAAPEGGVKYQLREADGKQVVWIDDNILKQNDGQPTHQFIANYIAEHIGEVYTILESGQKVYIGEELPKEYTQSKYTQTILRRNKSLLQAKNRAVSGMGEMIEIATNRRWEKTRHTQSKDAKYGMYRYDTSFGFPVLDDKGNVVRANVYSAELIIRNASDGKKYLYDIIDIKKDTASSDWLTKTQPERQETLPARGGNVFSESIAQRTQNVNRNLSEELTGSLHSDRDAGSAGPYAYDSLVSKPDMAVTRLSRDVPGNRADVIYQAKQNAAKIGRFNSKDGSVSVHVKDIDTDVILGTAGLKHSLDRRFDVNAPVTVMAGSILENSVRVNEMTAQHPNANQSYVLIGAAQGSNGQLYVVRSVVNQFSNEVTSMDVLYAYNAKTEPTLGIKEGTGRETIPNGPQRNAATITGSTISISELLDYVNDYFPDILPEEVLKHYGHESRPEGKLGESVLYSDRDPEAVKRNQILERQNEDLKDTVQYLKELVRLQGKVTDGTVYSRNSVEWAGKQMMKEANAKGDIRELTEILEKTYRAMGEGSEDMTQLIDQAAGWLADHRKTEKPRLDSYAEGILKEMKGRSPGGKGHR